MIHEIQIKIPVEAPTREEACKLLAPFIENPRNPNLLPRSATRLSFYFSYDGWKSVANTTPKPEKEITWGQVSYSELDNTGW